MIRNPASERRAIDAALTSPLTSLDPIAAWRRGLPILLGALVALRELNATDAEPLHEAISNEDVSRYISPPPPTIDAFARFIAWSERQRALGAYASFAVVPRGTDRPIGLFQVRAMESRFGAAEWGFAIAPEFWGSGVFADAARLVINFTFEVLGARRLEARSAVQNLRGNGALLKIGALHEATLRQSFMRGGELLDQALWTILADDWLDPSAPQPPAVVH